MAYYANGIKVRNLREIERSLGAIGAPRSEVKAAAKEAGDIIADEARSLVPVRTGKLRSTIKAVPLAGGRVVIRAGSPVKVPYANPIHWGWFYDKDNFIKKNIMPNPFFWKALKIKRQEVFDTYFKNMNDLINKWTRYAKGDYS